MDENNFRTFLKRAGKKEHVVDGLVSQVRTFEKYLAEMGRGGLEAVSGQEIEEYAETLSQSEIKARLRGLALYYRFAGNEQLARLAGILRERETAKSRRVFKLREFRGVKVEEVERLEALGIVTVEDMLAAGKTPEDRQLLSEKSGIPTENILELVKLSDLSRLGAVKAVRARLYYDAGLDTPDKFTQWEPEALRQMLVEFVECSGFDGIPPLPKEISNAIQTARRLPQVVRY